MDLSFLYRLEWRAYSERRAYKVSLCEGLGMRFMALRAAAPSRLRSATILLSKLDFEADHVHAFLVSKQSLHVYEKSDTVAARFIKNRLNLISGALKTKGKMFSHGQIDPGWYGLSEKKNPLVAGVMKIVARKERRKAKRVISALQNSLGERE